MPGATGAASTARRARSAACHASISSPGQQPGELLAADPRHHLALARAGPQAARHLAHHGVAGRVAVGVVDALEVVEVEQHQRQRGAGAQRAGGLLVQALLEGAVVRQLGERVGGGEAGQHAGRTARGRRPPCGGSGRGPAQPDERRGRHGAHGRRRSRGRARRGARRPPPGPATVSAPTTPTRASWRRRMRAMRRTASSQSIWGTGEGGTIRSGASRRPCRPRVPSTTYRPPRYRISIGTAPVSAGTRADRRSRVRRTRSASATSPARDPPTSAPLGVDPRRPPPPAAPPARATAQPSGCGASVHSWTMSDRRHEMRTTPVASWPPAVPIGTRRVGDRGGVREVRPLAGVAGHRPVRARLDAVHARPPLGDPGRVVEDLEDLDRRRAAHRLEREAGHGTGSPGPSAARAAAARRARSRSGSTRPATGGRPRSTSTAA